MGPEPTSSFTIPSTRDDVDLECRIYHPARFHNEDLSKSVRWAKKGAIFAHPYGPMGGCFDDPLVCSTVAILLKSGCVVGTFNFRGAGSSRGRTSWTAKPETEDYMSFIGFFVHYIDALCPVLPPSADGNSLFPPLATIQSEMLPPTNSRGTKAATLLLGGYSYGSLVTINLPEIDTILSKFSHVVKGTAAAEIRLRAAHMSRQWNQEAHESQRGRTFSGENSPRSPSALIFGGEESEPGTRRLSRDSRRSVDLVRRSVDLSRKRISIGRHKSKDSTKTPPTLDELEIIELPTPHTRFILISPLLPPISSFATMFTGNYFFEKQHSHASAHTEDGQVAGKPSKLSRYPTLAVYGDKDYFTSAKKLRKWSQQLASSPDSLFQYYEVTGAGHFWHEPGMESKLCGIVGDWVHGILQGPDA